MESIARLGEKRWYVLTSAQTELNFHDTSQWLGDTTIIYLKGGNAFKLLSAVFVLNSDKIQK